MSNFFLVDSYGNATASGNISADGYTINPSNSVVGQVLAYDGYSYVPTTISNGITGTFANDQVLFGNTASTTIQGSSNLTFDGYSLSLRHLLGNGSTPTIALGAASYSNATVSIVGTDFAGQFSYNGGTFTGSTSGNTLATITFNVPFSNPPVVLITPANQNAGPAIYTNLWTTSTATTWSLNGNTGVIGNFATAPLYNYVVIGN